MTLYSLTPEHLPVPRQLNLGMSFNHRTYDFADAIISARAAQVLEMAVTTYPIRRVVRCAARGRLEHIYDDLALKMGLTAHRLRHGSLFLDGPGVFVYAHGGQQAKHCSFTFNVWAASIPRATEARERLFELVGERRIRDEMFVLDWYFASGNTLSSTSLEDIASDVVHDEAYPDLGEPVGEFITRYLNAQETVLLLLGTPGSGKTRLVRAILREISRRKGESAEVMYTADARALESDEIFVEFITRTHDAFVIEDADHLLKPRADGNHNLHRFLAIADGVVRAQGRKILFTTNLPNIGDVDEALLRPGRCFATVRTRALAQPEAAKLVSRLSMGGAGRSESTLEALFAGGCKTASVASIYRACA